jgi:uncharacterized protein YkwD
MLREFHGNGSVTPKRGPSAMPEPLRRLAPIALAASLAFSAAAAIAPAVGAAGLTVTGAEQQMLGLLNGDRQKGGLVAVRVDTRLMAIARARATDMATRHYFSHHGPDGRNVFDILNEHGITWYGAGEIISWDTYPLSESAGVANKGWLDSAGHRDILMSTGYNYVGVGLATDASNGRNLWVAVFMKGPDRTGGWVSLDSVHAPAIASVAGARYRTVSVTWRGGDIQLVVLTAGLRDYQVQVRTDAGAWRWFTTSTTRTSQAIRLWRGHAYDLRVRACDRRANCGSWGVTHLLG